MIADRVVRLVPLPQLPQLRRLDAGHARPDAVIDIGELQPPVQARLRDAEVLRDLRQRSLAHTGNRDHVTAELQGERLGHDKHPSSEDQILTGKESTDLGAVPNAF